MCASTPLLAEENRDLNSPGAQQTLKPSTNPERSGGFMASSLRLVAP